MGFLSNFTSTVGGIITNFQDNRTQRIEARAEKRATISGYKQQANIAAYKAGIDPKASMWNGINDIFGQTIEAGQMYMATQNPIEILNPFKDLGGKGFNWKPIVFIFLIFGIVYYFFIRRR